ncbi:Pollen receptor-like kinase [Arachis hypogaea]|uniref:Pollen receptor-like kinase n=1 Tax=Arachis hypogaea TaxID=3818 RepID=A0A6B9V9H1_ARAHY|nr:Pollen receptor-like kinase [Arachis hypogaea]
MAVAPAITGLRPTLLFYYMFTTVVIHVAVTFSMSEAEALLTLKNSFSNAQALGSWVANSVPCSKDHQWDGVVCVNGLVSGLRLGGMGLLGEIDVDTLLELKNLRTISLVNNSFSGSIPQLNRIGFLKAMYLSGNKFSGNIPTDYFQRMRSLKKLWLSNNEFTGQIPASLAEIPQLVELHLENNQFSGNIPNLANPSLVDLNLSYNKLEGEVPQALSKFDESSFAGNDGICGKKIGKPCEKLPEETVIPLPVTNGSWNNKLQIAGFALTSLLLVALIIFFIVRSKRNKDNEEFGRFGNGGSIAGESVEVQVSQPVKREGVPTVTTVVSRKGSSKRGSCHGGSKGVGELVVVNDEKGVFGLSDLMKAAAEVLGNGGLGSCYKAVMSNGVAVVVKRTREMNALEKKRFDAEICRLGRLKHLNILTPLAYHFRKDEKLIMSEYVPGSSLLFLLHGDRGPSHAELDWPARLKIVRGIAEGMRYLHTELASSNVPHGNLKSSNVLLGPDYQPMLVDYGFSQMVNPSTATQALFAYKAPEAARGQVSHKSDVYCLGVVILEILTGKFPSQYLSNKKGGTDVVEWVTSAISEGRESELLDPQIANNKISIGQMVQLLHVGAACTESNPEQRIDIKEAIRRIEEVARQSGTTEVVTSLKDSFVDSNMSRNQGLGEEYQKRHMDGSESFGSQDYYEFGSFSSYNTTA